MVENMRSGLHLHTLSVGRRLWARRDALNAAGRSERGHLIGEEAPGVL